jgi:hypothetical protein
MGGPPTNLKIWRISGEFNELDLKIKKKQSEIQNFEQPYDLSDFLL